MTTWTDEELSRIGDAEELQLASARSVVFGLKSMLAHMGTSLGSLPALGLFGGIALYLLAHVALRMRIGGRLGRGRPIASAVLLGLLPLTGEVTGLTVLAHRCGSVRFADRR